MSPNTQTLAKNSRTHSGERLMKRRIRCAMGEAEPSIFDGSIGTATYNNEIVLIFSRKVKPSMSQGLQQTKMCFNMK